MADRIDVLRSHLAAVWDDREELVSRVAAQVIDQVPSYATTPSSEVWIGMTRILQRIVEGDPFAAPTPADLDAAAGTGIQGARANISASDLIEAVLLGAREVENDVMRRAEDAGVPADVRLDGVHRARYWAETVAVAAARGLEHAKAPEHRTAAVDLILGLRAGAAGNDLVALATRAHLDAGALHHVVVARSAGRATLDEVDAGRLRFATAGAWLTSEDVMVGVLTGRPGAAQSMVVGVSRPVPLQDLPGAFAEADRVCSAAHALLGAGRHDVDSLGLLLAVHEDTALMRRLDDRWLVPLRAESRHDLIRTVRCWQEHGQVDVVARKLSVHPNTVRNRLVRVDRLLPGWRLPQGQAELWAALVASPAD